MPLGSITNKDIFFAISRVYHAVNRWPTYASFADLLFVEFLLAMVPISHLTITSLWSFFVKEDLFDKSAKKKFTNIYKRQSIKTSGI